MSGRSERLGVHRLLVLLASHLQEYVDGDDLALEKLGTALDEVDFVEEDVQAFLHALRSFAGESTLGAYVAVEEAPAAGAFRVLSAEERQSLSPEAWGYLLDLRRRGSLDAGQFERVLDRLTAIGVRPIGVDLAREVAAHVALRADDDFLDSHHGDADLTH